MVFSTVEGAEKPKKYPLMFHEANAVILNKIDLLPYAGVSFDELVGNVEDVNASAPIFPVSCRTDDGIDIWVEWLRSSDRAADFKLSRVRRLDRPTRTKNYVVSTEAS